MKLLSDFCTSFLLLVGIGILLGGFLQALTKVVERDTPERPWEGWRR